ncbi:MAG: BMP family ABC transporter substrate-binding protein [Firmicutes bacterium]|nr:BMP family ABC transporter substrate-binding protein [Bacillota bacterium]
MFKRFFVPVILFLIVAMALSGCSGSEEADDGQKKVAVLFPFLIDDGAWNEEGYKGLLEAEKEGIKIAYTEQVRQAEQIEVFRNYAQEGYDVIIGHGGEYMQAALTVAKEFPETLFVVTNGTEVADNVSCVTFNFEHRGFVAGAFAGLMTETGKVAEITGEEIPVISDQKRGFEAGLKYVNPEAEFRFIITGSWDDVEIGREATIAFIESGGDVILNNLDSGEIGLFSAAEDYGAMVIGQYIDQTHLGPNCHIGSGAASPGILVYHAATMEQEGGKIIALGAAEGGVNMSAFSDKVPEEVREKVLQIQQDLGEGKIQF